MTMPSRAPLRVFAVSVVTGLTLTGCGSSPAAKTAASPTPSAASSSTASAEPSATVSPSSADAQVVKVAKFRISFELPKGWITLDAKKVMKGGDENPFLDEMADRLGTTRQQLAQSFSSVVQTLSVSDGGAVHGFLDNVNTIGQDGDLNDDQIKLQLAAIGAKPGAFVHATTPAGDVLRVPYDLPSKVGLTIRGVAIAVLTGDATVIITVSSSSAEQAATIADQVQASLKHIPGNGPDV